MPRPEHLGIVETHEIIRSINARQAEYDRDPESYERREREHKEERQRQEEEELYYARQQYEEEQKRAEEQTYGDGQI
ncbi:MAG: hypothetical protein WCX73_05060 [Candidatus Pacearchaeota archaeon]|jgi:hypothetical protein